MGKSHLGGYHNADLQLTVYSLVRFPICGEMKGAHFAHARVTLLAVVADVEGLAGMAHPTTGFESGGAR